MTYIMYHRSRYCISGFAAFSGSYVFIIIIINGISLTDGMKAMSKYDFQSEELLIILSKSFVIRKYPFFLLRMG